MSYAIYLRKSQADLEAEASGAGETLSRHRMALLELAKRMQLEIGAVYEEIVSGETIAARPQMQKLLSEVGTGKWEGVLVMEVERLARGDSIDQGIVSQAFKFSGTKIITPLKIYDPTNEMDEEYLEFGLFMSRREYNTIKRRMVAGRIASVKEGKYMGKVDPFGYRRIKLEHEKGWSLDVVPEQAEIIRKIYEMYLAPGGSVTAVARYLKSIGSKTRLGADWSRASVIQTLKNPLYCGYVTWGHKPTRKAVEDGHVTKKRYLSNDYVKVRGRHTPLVTEDDWNAAQKKLRNTPGYKVRSDRTMRNPFQKLMYCADCGHAMQLSTSTRNGKPNYSIFCPWPHCTNVSSRLDTLDNAVQDALRGWLQLYKVRISHEQQTLPQESDTKAAIANSRSELTRVDEQMQRAFDFVEQGIYTPEQFLERRRVLAGRREELSAAIQKLEDTLQSVRRIYDMSADVIPRIESVLNAYPAAETAEEKNNLLCSVLRRIIYQKHPSEAGNAGKYELNLDFLPIIPSVED